MTYLRKGILKRVYLAMKRGLREQMNQIRPPSTSPPEWLLTKIIGPCSSIGVPEEWT